MTTIYVEQKECLTIHSFWSSFISVFEGIYSMQLFFLAVYMERYPEHNKN